MFDDEDEGKSPLEPRPSATPQLPANMEAEAALLAAVMVENSVLDVVTAIVTAGDFYDHWHGKIFARIVDLVADGHVASPASLFPFFKDEWIKFPEPEDPREPRDPDMRVAEYIARLTSGYGGMGGAAAIIGARDFAEQIRDLSRLRRLHDIYKDAAMAALDTSEEIAPGDLISATEAKYETLTNAELRMRSSTVQDAWDELVGDMESKETEERSGFIIPDYTDWNDVAGRMDPESGDLIYLGGRPSMGKSGVAFKVGAGAAAAGIATEIIGIEMGKKPTMRRIMADRIYRQGVTSPYSHLARGDLKMDDWRAIGEERELLASWPLNVSTPEEMDVEDIGPHIRMRKRKLARKGQKLGLVVIDYLGQLGTKKDFRNTNDRITYISQTLKRTAKREHVAMVVLVQLSRGVESREDKRPLLSDMRDSGSLEQDADVVVFVYRDEYYLERAEPPKTDVKKYEKWQDEMAAVADRIELYSAKRREGALCKRTGFFFTRHQAIRSSSFYNSDLYRRDHQPGTFFENDGAFAEQRG